MSPYDRFRSKRGAVGSGAAASVVIVVAVAVGIVGYLAGITVSGNPLTSTSAVPATTSRTAMPIVTTTVQKTSVTVVSVTSTVTIAAAYGVVDSDLDGN